MIGSLQGLAWPNHRQLIIHPSWAGADTKIPEPLFEWIFESLTLTLVEPSAELGPSEWVSRKAIFPFHLKCFIDVKVRMFEEIANITFALADQQHLVYALPKDLRSMEWKNKFISFHLLISFLFLMKYLMRSQRNELQPSLKAILFP